MKIKRLTIENFMRLVAVDITPKGNAIFITGKNAAGKSSLIKAIKALFQGKKYHPDKPIRDGADKAEIIGETEDFIIKRTFTKAGGDSVTVTNAEGMKATSTQGLLDKFYGEFSFEPMAFYEDCKNVKKKREQLNTLMKLVGLDFTDINAEIAEVKDQRSIVKTSKETYDFEAKQIPELPDVGDELIQMSELTEKLTLATQLNVKHTETVSQIEAGQQEIENIKASLEKGKEHKATLRREFKAALQNAEEAQYAGEKTFAEAQIKQEDLAETLEPLIDVAAINQAIEKADSRNEQVRKKKQRTELLKKSAAKSREFAELLKETKTLEAKKAKRLAAVKMPIEGLSVNEETILFNDPNEPTGAIPLAQVNDSMQLQIAVAISIALNPKLEVVLMKGNDLDKKNLEAVCKMAEEKGYQFWIEKQSDDKKNETGFIIEDGSVVPADKKETLLHSAEKAGKEAATDQDVLFKDEG